MSDVNQLNTTFGLGFEDVWEEGVTVYSTPQALFRCITLNIPQLSSATKHTVSTGRVVNICLSTDYTYKFLVNDTKRPEFFT
jgi:hypothetical protein